MNKRYSACKELTHYALLLLVVIFAGVWDSADAEEQKLICSEEIAKYCKAVKPGQGRLLLCLKEHEKDLSTTCREKISGIEKRLDEAKQICAEDMEKFCKGIQIGEGRVARCLKEHIQEISPGCRERVFGLEKMVPGKKAEQ